MESKVLEITDLSADTKELKFTLLPEFSFEPGQFVILFTRAYTIVDVKDNQLTLIVKKIDGGFASTKIHDLNLNDIVEIKGPFKGITLKGHDAIFISAGCGVTPFISMIPVVLKQGKKATLYASYKYANEIIYDDYFKALESQYPNFKYYVAISREGQKQHIQDILDISHNFSGEIHISGFKQR